MKLHAAFSFLTLLSLSVMGQSPVGLWSVFSVELADQQMTPQAKWSQIYPDGRYLDGNGWQQHHTGHWVVDEGSGTLRMIADQGPVDNQAPFQLTFRGDTMVWQRMEENMPLTVKWLPIEELPLAPRDLLQGLWAIEGTEDELFIRWDDRYVWTRDGVRHQGYYIGDGHRPEVTLLPFDSSEEPSSWMIVEEGEALVLRTDEAELRLVKLSSWRD
ncbi:hypothetical protein HZ996_05710 [Cryomorphaceae bacterium]|nr:hypothetical protein HZ996_05710 [Cryomorphaceae bacterium]